MALTWACQVRCRGWLAVPGICLRCSRLGQAPWIALGNASTNNIMHTGKQEKKNCRGVLTKVQASKTEGSRLSQQNLENLSFPEASLFVRFSLGCH